MSIKILGGLAKGQALFVPPETITRPTSVMLRRKVFDALQDLSDFHFFDLCAGSGAMGIEAWSRGAKSATLVEAHPKVQGILKKNLSGIKAKFAAELAERPIHLAPTKLENWLARELSGLKNLDSVVVFLDPPYKDHSLYQAFRAAIGECEFAGEVWVESDRLSGVAVNFFETWHGPHKIYEHSDSWLARWKFPKT